MQAATLLAVHANHDVGGVLCTLLWIVFVIAAVIAVVALLISLLGGGTRWPIFTNWIPAAAVALIAGLLLLFLC